MGKLVHGDYKNKKFRFYRIWMGMRNRCFVQEHYRDISVCKRWDSYKNFKLDMYKDYVLHCAIFGEKNTTIDRIDNKGDYSLDNCRWNTISGQVYNSSRVKMFRGIRLEDECQEESISQVNFAIKHGLRQGHISNCLLGRRNTHLGWRFEYV